MPHWLLKTEPSTYSFADLAQERNTRWDGVANPMAQKNLRAMRVGDGVAIYHTGSEKAVVGFGRVGRAAYPDPGNGKLVVVDLEAGSPARAPVTLAALKAEEAFAGSELVRIPRLSVVPLSKKQWGVIARLGRTARG
jgi:predicted RNA-binding protein with PUA-like domain